jgi:hypothetical protein
MLILLFLLLLLASLAAWVWLTERIWRISPVGAAASFILALPALYFCYAHWNDPKAGLRLPAIVNIVLTVLVLLVGVKVGSAALDRFMYGDEVARQKNPQLRAGQPDGEMTAWCRTKHQAAYDHELGTCVERGKDDAETQQSRQTTLDNLKAWFKQNGLDGEFDQTPTKAADALLAGREISGVAAFNLYPLSMEQKPVALLICVSAAACIDHQRSTADAMLRNANLLLVTQADDARTRQLQAAFARYRPG